MPNLYCLIHGNPELSLFRIKYDKNTIIADLKKVIWMEEVKVEQVKSKDLILYQVNIDLTTENLQRTALSNKNANIVNDLGGQVLRPIDNVEEKFSETDNKHINIIVDVPIVALPVVARRDDDVIIARLDKIDDKINQNFDRIDQNIDRINKNIEDLRRESSSVHISNVTEGNWMKILEFTGLDYEATEREVEFSNLDLELNEKIDAFKWTDAIERSQNDRYKTHLRDILKLSIFQKLGLYDPTGDDKFLSTNTDILPMRLSGTTDLVIVDRYSIACEVQEKHIRVLFGLKKVVIKKHTFQIMAELISADLKSKHSVLAVLTDLIDDWRFFWIKGKIIMRLTLSRAESIVLIRHNLTLANKKLRELANQASYEHPLVIQKNSKIDIESSFFEEELLPKRQKLRHVIATSNVSSDIAPMEDFFDTMSEEEIFRYKAKKILTQFFSQPIFNELDDKKEILLQSDNEKNILD
ncbi:hypothetical protein C1645_735389 [Glomus cerebriforme]|uniref:Crinkler effector protein N-terminal domain-containing protein n=1 Tax=Glomus cerebriforme TaxID=658196 RepID=A0A397T8G7_9GLOM|nr:hypothetical protein C1645_735389 [Glomus cerebriforme]